MPQPAILVATDFSPPAAHALERAALVAQQKSATLHLLHVLPPVSWKMFGQALQGHPEVSDRQLQEAARRQLEQVADECRQRHALDLQVHLTEGRPRAAIAACAQDVGAELTVLGPHAGHFGRDLFVGSTAAHCLQAGVTPLLIAQAAPQGPWQTVLVPVDFSPASLAAIKTAAYFAPQAALHVLHVYGVEFEGKMRYAGVTPDVIDKYRQAAADQAGRHMAQLIQSACLPLLPLIRHGYPAREILAEAEALRADLIVTGKHQRAGLDRWLLGSVTEALLFGLNRDLLTVAVPEQAA